MNIQAERVLDSMLRRSPAQSYFRRKASARLAVLAYHGVDDLGSFERHLDHLERAANVVGLPDVLDAFDGHGSLPDRPVLITFDDGHRSVLDRAMPALRARGMSAAVFVVAGLVGTDRPFWWTEVIELATAGGVVAGLAPASPTDLVRTLKRLPDERRRLAIEELRATSRGPVPSAGQLTASDLRALESGGIVVGNHTWSHPSLPRCAGQAARKEIERAHAALTEMLGHRPETFAYPYGERHEGSAAVVRELGYRAAFLFDHHLSPTRPADPLAVSRLRVNSTTTLDRFQVIVSGLHPSIHRARGGR